MGKLGKKARKFAKKNLQSVLRARRKTKGFLRKKASSKRKNDSAEEQVNNTTVLSNGRNTDGEVIEDASLDALFIDDDSNVVADASDSDGFLSEDSSCANIVEVESEINLEDNNISTLSMHNRKISEELTVQKNKLDRFKKKDLEFSKFLESYDKGVETFRNDETSSDEDEISHHGMQFMDEDESAMNKGIVLSSSVINSWCQLVRVEHSESALTSILNAYRAACHYGTKLIGRRIQNSETFCNVLMFVLHDADSIFRGLLKIPSSNCKKQMILELKNTSKWKNLKPLVKSYLRSTLFLLNQVTDSEILYFSLTRLRASLIFFAAFPSLLHKLIKIAVHLWATGGGTLSSSSFVIIRDVAAIYNSDCYDTCLIKTFNAYIAQIRVPETVNLKHIKFLRYSLVELCSLDVQKSNNKALSSIHQLGKILQLGLQTKKKEAVKKICSWEYSNCIDIWVMFISANVRDYDLQTLFNMTIQLINGVSHMFPGPRYFPLRLKCIHWLNNLSSCSGIFIPIASFVLDILEYKIGKEGGKTGKTYDFLSVLKLPKQLLKLQTFQEECVVSAIELLSAHFAQWSYHISFPELAAIPLIHLRKFHETTYTESWRRVVKRLIDQVEQNVEFVQKKRDEVSFSPEDHQSVESFLQIEKQSLKAPFTQYYRSVMEKAAIRKLQKNDNISYLEQGKLKRKRERLPNNMVDAVTNAENGCVRV
ncbi:unnamed protein product [Ilex paraguariensis]|uniref:Nucleolar complex protein 2 homolog n=1 Tax=Ilex paraguariensis TaxID=185542 RepID=A0ABC8S4S3_9AQUA